MTSFDEYLSKYMNSEDKDDDDNNMLNEPLGKLIDNCSYYDLTHQYNSKHIFSI